MADFSCEITVGGQPVQLAPREESAAMRKANSVFCPLGPAPTRAWFVMLSKHAASLTSAATSVAWRQVGDGTKTLTFRGLYPVSAARVFPGAPGDPNGLVLVELVDARALVAENSDAGKINANIRSYAHEEDYLSGTTGYTWTSLATELWSACGLLGAFPGLPYAPDGVPQNTRFWGVSAFRALCAVLDHLDCAIRHNPLAGTYSIVQLGASQTIPANSQTLVWDREPRGFNGDVAATVKVYAANHYRSYGQERDAERATNWSTDGAGSVSSNASGVTGAQGVRPLWDDLPRILDEDNTIENNAAISTRAAARAARYALRMGVDPKHRVHRGLLSNILPGAQVRAVLWRSWGDGTVTEFTAGADLVSGPDFAPLSLPAHENYLAPDLGRRSYPNYPRIANVIQVYHSAGTQGETVEANADGFHPARVRRWVAGAMATLEDCWIRFIDDHDNADGDVDATDGEFYGPGRLCGIETSDGQTLPVYLVRKGGDATVDVVRVYHSGSSIGADVAANAGGVHPGQVKRIINGVMTYIEDCWIAFVDDYDTESGTIKAVNGDYYGPARLSGEYTHSAVTLPLYVLRRNFERIVRFELTSTLSLSGNAEAIILSDDDADWADTALAIQVYDWFAPEGMWAGIAGYRGYAIRREGVHASGRQKYDIQWMEQIAQTIQFTTTEYMGATTAGRVAVTVNWYDHQGKEPAGSLIIRDPQGQFPDVHSGAKGTAVYDYHNGYYRIVSCQRVALFATALLNGAACVGTMTIDGFAVRQTGDYVGEPPTTPTAATNTCDHAGLDNDAVLLRRTNNTMPSPSWEVVDVAKHSKTVMTDVRVDALTLQKKSITIYVELCDNATPSWTTWHTGGECP